MLAYFLDIAAVLGTLFLLAVLAREVDRLTGAHARVAGFARWLVVVGAYLAIFLLIAGAVWLGLRFFDRRNSGAQERKTGAHGVASLYLLARVEECAPLAHEAKEMNAQIQKAAVGCLFFVGMCFLTLGWLLPPCFLASRLVILLHATGRLNIFLGAPSLEPALGAVSSAGQFATQYRIVAGPVPGWNWLVLEGGAVRARILLSASAIQFFREQVAESEPLAANGHPENHFLLPPNDAA